MANGVIIKGDSVVTGEVITPNNPYYVTNRTGAVYKTDKVAQLNFPLQIQSLAAGNNEGVMTIPVGYRPIDTVTHKFYGVSGGQWYNIAIRSTGSVDVYNYGATISGAENMGQSVSYVIGG